jgi:hypothetical protein
MGKKEIERFVRDALGCTCPPEIFDEIAVERDAEIASGLLSDAVLRIGNRLLIYVVNGRAVGDRIPEIVQRGKKEREELGFNRFRLVLRTDAVAELRKNAIKVFESLPELDDRVHLHVIDENDIREIFN